MNKKILSAIIVIFILGVVSTPVLAIGPENALGKNPNLVGPSPWGFDLVLENGVAHGWIIVTPIPKTELVLDAQKFKIDKAIVVTIAAQVNEIENKWLFLSQNVWYDFLILMGTPPPMAEYIASMHPEGLYFRWNYVGQ
jgi:hypothetical protein